MVYKEWANMQLAVKLWESSSCLSHQLTTFSLVCLIQSHSLVPHCSSYVFFSEFLLRQLLSIFQNVASPGHLHSYHILSSFPSTANAVSILALIFIVSVFKVSEFFQKPAVILKIQHLHSGHIFH